VTEVVDTDSFGERVADNLHVLGESEGLGLDDERGCLLLDPIPVLMVVSILLGAEDVKENKSNCPLEDVGVEEVGSVERDKLLQEVGELEVDAVGLTLELTLEGDVDVAEGGFFVGHGITVSPLSSGLLRLPWSRG